MKTKPHAIAVETHGRGKKYILVQVSTGTILLNPLVEEFFEKKNWKCSLPVIISGILRNSSEWKSNSWTHLQDKRLSPVNQWLRKLQNVSFDLSPFTWECCAKCKSSFILRVGPLLLNVLKMLRLVKTPSF